MYAKDRHDATTRRTDLRTLDAYYSARQIYAAQWCPYPGGVQGEGGAP
jgi:hypothetical protein